MKRFKNLFFTGLVVVLTALFVCSSSWLASEGVERTPELSVKKEVIDARIEAMRTEIKANGYTFTVGYNPAMEYELEELSGFNPTLKRPLMYVTKPGKPGTDRPAETLPSYYISPYVTPVKNQGNCGSC